MSQVHLAAAGDEPAFLQIYETHRRDVARLVCRLVGPRSDLEELIQSVFFQAHENLKVFRGAKVRTRLYRITVDTLLMQRRFADVPASEGLLLQRLLARLTDKKRVVFVLHELEGLSPAEISEIVGTPVLTVRTRLFYARRELEAMLRDEPALSAYRAEVTSASLAE